MYSLGKKKSHFIINNTIPLKKIIYYKTTLLFFWQWDNLETTLLFSDHGTIWIIYLDDYLVSEKIGSTWAIYTRYYQSIP